MSKIFISYRRSESAYVTGRICDRLTQHFGSDSIFTDVDRIPVGLDFRAVIEEQVGNCEVLLAVIGAGWLEVKDTSGRLRLHNPADFVRIEIESALRRGIPVVPLLLDGIEMPLSEQLPESLHDLAFRNGTQIRPDPDFHSDMNRLIKGLQLHLARPIAADTQPGSHTEPEIPDMVVIAPGRFEMGDIHGAGRGNELPVHTVRFTKPFAIARYPVTFDQYDLFARTSARELPDDRGWGTGSRPVINVSWEEATGYARWLSQCTGSRYRLPSEAEWEYAARSGGNAELWPGTTAERKLVDYAWYSVNSERRTQPVGGRKANGLGLHDMAGNVWEWVLDSWHADYDGAPADGSAWLSEGDGSCVLRGGSWGDNAETLRCSRREKFSSEWRYVCVGFRLAQDLD